MKSRLLACQLQEVFGGEGETQLRELIESARSAGQRSLADGLEKIIEQVDASYAAYAGLNNWQAMLSGDALTDWDLRSGKIESGRHWKEMLGYGADELDNSIAQWQRLVHPEDLRVLQARMAAHAAALFGPATRVRGKGTVPEGRSERTAESSGLRGHDSNRPC